MGFFSRLFGLEKDDGYNRNLDGYYSDSEFDRSPPHPKKKKKSWLQSLFENMTPAPRPNFLNIHMKPYQAIRLIDEISAGKMYHEKSIPREGKEPRILSVPHPYLKNIQRRILNRILTKTECHNAAHGFMKHRSIFTTLESHTGKRVVVVIDIRNFFDTISAKRVCGMFKSLGFSPQESAVLAKLCCYKNKLPQGAPTSPMIGNIICRKLDSRLSGLANKKGCSYTRYADDLIFSGESKIVGSIPFIKQIINKEGFEIAEEKFRIMRSGSRQRVLGLNVNEKVSIPRNVRRIIRAMVHKQLHSDEPDESLLDFLYGHVGLMASAHPSQARKLKRKLNKIRKRMV